MVHLLEAESGDDAGEDDKRKSTTGNQTSPPLLPHF